MRKTTTKQKNAGARRSRPKSRKRSVPAQRSNSHQKTVSINKPVSVSSMRARNTRKLPISTDIVNKSTDVQEVLGTMAAITGGVLGVMSVVVAAPIALALTGLGAVGLGVAGVLSSAGQNYYRTAKKTVVEVSRAVDDLAESASQVSARH